MKSLISFLAGSVLLILLGSSCLWGHPVVPLYDADGQRIEVAQPGDPAPAVALTFANAGLPRAF